MNKHKKTTERVGAQGGLGVAENNLKSHYSSAVDAGLLMVSFVLGLVAGCLL